MNGFKQFIDSNKNLDIEIRFIGAAVRAEGSEVISTNLKGYEKYYSVTGRVSKSKLIDEMNNADLLLLVSHGRKYKGVATSKILTISPPKSP